MWGNMAVLLYVAGAGSAEYSFVESITLEIIAEDIDLNVDAEDIVLEYTTICS
jgi:hypothetical protein